MVTATASASHSGASSHEAVLRVEGLAVGVGPQDKRVSLVEDISLEIHPGRTLCVVGESGCGKSLTSLSIMGLLRSPPRSVTAGRVLFDGQRPA